MNCHKKGESHVWRYSKATKMRRCLKCKSRIKITKEEFALKWGVIKNIVKQAIFFFQNILIDISCICPLYIMAKPKNKIRSQKNKNNKTKPENLMKKQYLESYEELKKSIKDQQT